MYFVLVFHLFHHVLLCSPLLPNQLSPIPGPIRYTHWASTILFVYFGFKLLHEAYEMDPNPTGTKEELEEVEQELAEKDGDVEEGVTVSRKSQLAILTQAFTLTFLAEWGDRSQIATIALASAKDPYGVTLGGVIGHGFCTGLAVIGGRLLATRISEVRSLDHYSTIIRLHDTTTPI